MNGGPGLKESGRAGYDAGPAVLRDKVRLGEAGRFVIPAALREAMGVKPGDMLMLQVNADGELRVIGQTQAVRRIQRYAAQFKKPGESIVDEFIAEKRIEAERE